MSIPLPTRLFSSIFEPIYNKFKGLHVLHRLSLDGPHKYKFLSTWPGIAWILC